MFCASSRRQLHLEILVQDQNTGTAGLTEDDAQPFHLEQGPLWLDLSPCGWRVRVIRVGLGDRLGFCLDGDRLVALGALAIVGPLGREGLVGGDDDVEFLQQLAGCLSAVSRI